MSVFAKISRKLIKTKGKNKFYFLNERFGLETFLKFIPVVNPLML